MELKIFKGGRVPPKAIVLVFEKRRFSLHFPNTETLSSYPGREMVQVDMTDEETIAVSRCLRQPNGKDSIKDFFFWVDHFTEKREASLKMYNEEERKWMTLVFEVVDRLQRTRDEMMASKAESEGRCVAWLSP